MTSTEIIVVLVMVAAVAAALALRGRGPRVTHIDRTVRRGKDGDGDA
ncbi:MAG: hypothetical protein ABIW33_03060 [Sphingomicrobium sp.]